MTPAIGSVKNPYNTVLVRTYHLAIRHQRAKLVAFGKLTQMQFYKR